MVPGSGLHEQPWTCADLGGNYIKGLVGLPLFQLLADAEDDAQALVQAVLCLLCHKLRALTALCVLQGPYQMRPTPALGDAECKNKCCVMARLPGRVPFTGAPCSLTCSWRCMQ